MPPSLAEAYGAGGWSANAVFFGNSLLRDSLRIKRSNLEHIAFGEFSVVMLRSGSGGIAKFPIGVKLIGGRCHPLQVMWAIVCFPSILVVHLMSRGRKIAYEGGSHKAMNSILVNHHIFAKRDTPISVLSCLAREFWSWFRPPSITPWCDPAHIAKVADLVESIVPYNRFPVFHLSSISRRNSV